MAAYSRSPGSFLRSPAAAADPAAAKLLLDQRDEQHRAVYGHAPGRSPVCTLSPREAYEDAARVQAAPEARTLIPDGCTTAEAQAFIDRAAPWWHRPNPGADPALEQAHRELAQQIAAQQVTG
jgi:hypothetical protein